MVIDAAGELAGMIDEVTVKTYDRFSGQNLAADGGYLP